MVTATDDQTVVTPKSKNQLKRERKLAVATIEQIDHQLGTTETVVKPKRVRKALRTFGKGLIDTDLRDIGHGVKHVVSAIPVPKIVIDSEKGTETVEEPEADK